MIYIAYKQAVFLYTKHFESVTSEIAAASGLLLKAKMWKCKVRFVNEKIDLCHSCVFCSIISSTKKKNKFPFKHFKTTIHNTIIPFYTQPSICIIPLTLPRESWVPPPTMFQNPQTPEGSLFPIKNEWIVL